MCEYENLLFGWEVQYFFKRLISSSWKGVTILSIFQFYICLNASNSLTKYHKTIPLNFKNIIHVTHNKP